MSAKISKTVYTFTVLHPTDQPPADLGDALREAFDGHSVGLSDDGVTTPVDDSQVAYELVKLGNDGEFFDLELGLA